MDIKERMRKVNEHFKNLSIEEFEKFLEENLCVYCTNCIHFRLDDEDLPYCMHEDKCNINDCEDSKPIKERPFYEEKNITY